MSNTFEFQLDGLDELMSKISEAIPKIREEVGRELYQFGEDIMDESYKRVPVDTGALMSTGKVMPPTDEGDEVSVVFGYGDESVGYAYAVHEMMDILPYAGARMYQSINWTRPNSGPKYLENPFKEKIDELPDRVRDAVLRTIAE